MIIPVYIINAALILAFIQVLRSCLLLDNQVVTGGEIIDKLVFASLLISSVIGGIALQKKQGKKFTSFAKARFVLGLYTLTYGIASLDTLPGTDTSSLWMGFGRKVMLLSSFIVFVICVPSIRIRAARLAHFNQILEPIGIAMFLYYSITTIQFPFSIRDTYHSRFIFNEAAGLWLGKRPLKDIVNQYSYLFGQALKHVKILAADSVQVFLWSSCISLWIGTTLTVLLLVWLGRKCLPNNYRWLAWFVVVPCILTKGENNTGWDGSLSVIYSALPIRLFFFAAGGAILSAGIADIARGRRYYFLSSVIGLVGGLSIVNNLEFGLATSVALIATWTADSACRKSVKETLIGSCTVVCSLFIPVIVFTSGVSLKGIARWGSYVLSFGKGFGSSEISTAGPQYIVLPILFASLGYSVWLYRHRLTNRSLYEYSHHTRLRHALLYYSSVFGAIGMPYYLNRSIASAQLQIFLAPFALCSLILATDYLKSIHVDREEVNLKRLV